MKNTKALKDYAMAIELNSKYHAAFGARAHLYRVIEKHQEAVEDYTAAIVLEPSWSLGYVGRGQSQEALGMLDDAMADYEKASREDESNPEPWKRMQLLYNMSGQSMKAEDCARKHKELSQ
jgi:tetratricopeptide (TPR) repeat protein